MKPKSTSSMEKWAELWSLLTRKQTRQEGEDLVSSFNFGGFVGDVWMLEMAKSKMNSKIVEEVFLVCNNS
jgi:hypothetical protein